MRVVHNGAWNVVEGVEKATVTPNWMGCWMQNRFSIFFLSFFLFFFLCFFLFFSFIYFFSSFFYSLSFDNAIQDFRKTSDTKWRFQIFQFLFIF